MSVQETTFSVDALGRFVCSIFREHPDKRVLVLDAGRFLVSEHVQNLGRIGLDVPEPIRPADDPGVARKLVWGLPWRGNVDFPGLADCNTAELAILGVGVGLPPIRPEGATHPSRARSGVLYRWARRGPAQA